MAKPRASALRTAEGSGCDLRGRLYWLEGKQRLAPQNETAGFGPPLVILTEIRTSYSLIVRTTDAVGRSLTVGSF